VLAVQWKPSEIVATMTNADVDSKSAHGRRGPS
jgi:hypothetical protein